MITKQGEFQSSNIMETVSKSPHWQSKSLWLVPHFIRVGTHVNFSLLSVLNTQLGSFQLKEQFNESCYYWVFDIKNGIWRTYKDLSPTATYKNTESAGAFFKASSITGSARLSIHFSIRIQKNLLVKYLQHNQGTSSDLKSPLIPRKEHTTRHSPIQLQSC